MKTPLDVLTKYWNHNSFRPFQEEIIDSALNGNDTFAILPTGGGKSVCFQVPALLKEGVCIVVTPLIALMKDQVKNLLSKGIKAVAIHSGMSPNEIDIVLDNMIFGAYKFVYLSPERLKTDIFRYRASKVKISFLVIDEAHCISQWGYDFRKEYLTIKEVFTSIPRVPIIALTASATSNVIDDICDKLSMVDPAKFIGSFKRESLSYVVRQTDDKYGQLLRISKGIKGSGIVYVRERKKCIELASFLKSQGLKADSYHAGFSSKFRDEIQLRWMRRDFDIIVCTNAFGMGIDKPDVRFVCHFDMPESMEAYYQEAGRAGRDGLKSFAILLWNSKDISRLKRIISISFSSEEYIRDIYQKIYQYYNIAYGDGKDDLRKFNLEDFGKKYGLNYAMAYYALKNIENEGYLELTEELDNPSRVMFIVGREELYLLQLKDNVLDTFIKTLLRLYEGVFSYSVSIDEEYIARVTRNSIINVKTILLRLSRLNILKYIPGSVSPLIIFKEERLIDKGLYIDSKAYLMRKEAFVNRIDTVIEYASNNSECRSKVISKYFGENIDKECMECDICKIKAAQ